MNSFSISIQHSQIIVVMSDLKGLNLVVKPTSIVVTDGRRTLMSIESADKADYCIHFKGLQLCLKKKAVIISKGGTNLAEISFEKREIVLFSKEGKTTIRWMADGEKIKLVLPITETPMKQE